ncbi:MAG: hypothetical protein NTX40_00570, partial [Planctomycetota bacterium]|nr:hypothetical protein [Planctomycetota bacterium]
MRTLGLAVALLACAVLGLAGGATPAMGADATWTGYGDGVNWSDMANWENIGHTGWQTGDPRPANTAIKLNFGSDDTSTVNIDAQVAPWVGTSTSRHLYLWIQSLEYDSGRVGRKLPVHRFLVR